MNDNANMALRAEATTLAQQAAAITITDVASLAVAAEFRERVRKLIAKVKDTFAEPIEAAHRAHKAAIAARDGLLAPLTPALDAVSASMERFHQQERARQRAEQERIDAEVRRREAEERRIAEEARMRIAERIQQETGDTAAALEVLEAPIAPAPVFVPRAAPPPKVAGIAMVETIACEIVDPMMVPREWCIPDERRIKAQVKATGMQTTIPGVRVYPVATVRSTGR